MRSILMVLITVLCFNAKAQTLDSTQLAKRDSATKAVLVQSSAGHIMWHDIKDGFYDLGQYVLRPFHWDVREWGIIATGIGFTAVLELADDVPFRNIIQSNKGKVGDEFVNFGNNF